MISSTELVEFSSRGSSVGDGFFSFSPRCSDDANILNDSCDSSLTVVGADGADGGGIELVALGSGVDKDLGGGIKLSLSGVTTVAGGGIGFGAVIDFFLEAKSIKKKISYVCIENKIRMQLYYKTKIKVK